MYGQQQPFDFKYRDPDPSGRDFQSSSLASPNSSKGSSRSQPQMKATALFYASLLEEEDIAKVAK